MEIKKNNTATPVAENGNKNPAAKNGNNSTQKEGYHKKKNRYNLISEEQMNTINGVQHRMDMAFSKLVTDKKWNNVTIAEEFYPYISGASAVSRILSGAQHVNFNTILVLAVCYGYSLDEILLGRKQGGYTLTPADIAALTKILDRTRQCSDSN